METLYLWRHTDLVPVKRVCFLCINCFLVQRSALLTFHLIIEPPSPIPQSRSYSLSPSHSKSKKKEKRKTSKSVSDRVCCMSRMPACLVPTSPGSGDMVSSPLSPGNRHVRLPPPGGGVGMKAEEWEETSRFFLFVLFFSPSRAIQWSVHIQTHGQILVHTKTLPVMSSNLRIGKNWCFTY